MLSDQTYLFKYSGNKRWTLFTAFSLFAYLEALQQIIDSLLQTDVTHMKEKNKFLF